MRIPHAVNSFSRTLARAFPTPETIFPRSAGIDISDASVKWLALARSGEHLRVTTWGEEPLQEGVVVNGAILNVEALCTTLRNVKKHLGGITYAHAALPEEAAYVFEMHIPDGTSRAQAVQMIEFESEGRVPIPAAQAVYDFDIIKMHDDNAGEEIAVAVFPLELAQSYVAAFEGAGITLLSLEVEARSIARAISLPTAEEPITLMVDFGRARTGIAVLKHGIPIFTSTVEVGGETMNRVLQEKLSLDHNAAIAFRNEQGLIAQGGASSAGVQAVIGVAGALADEISRHYHYWDTRRNEHGERMTPVGRVVLVGGSANLKGLTEYIAGRVQAPTVLGDIWQRICDFNDYIPPIDHRESLQYATAAGLALRGV